MPPCITAITSQKKNKNRINIFIDGQYAFSISRALAADIREGDEIRPNRIDQLKKADEQETAYGRALHFLKFRPRSAAEIERYLEGKHFSLETITTTVNRLETHGLIDDAAFARLFVENRLRFRPRGAYALRFELKSKGISEAIIKTVLDGYDEERAAWEALLPKIKQWKTLEKKAFQKKAVDFLRRRGFSYATCARAWEQAAAHLNR